MKNIEKIIFDLDNTLILWKDEYLRATKETVEEFNVGYDYKRIDAILGAQERTHEILTKEGLLEDINRECNLSLSIDFIDILLEKQKGLAESNNCELIKTIEYLSSKYELVLLTNWFTETQIGRLETAGIKKYFTSFYGGDTGKMKPHKESFLRALGNTPKDKCVMIGDSDYMDIAGAINSGINVIKCDFHNKDNENHDYPVIKKITELKDIL